MTVYTDIYTLQLCIIGLTQGGWHTLRFPNMFSVNFISKEGFVKKTRITFPDC